MTNPAAPISITFENGLGGFGLGVAAPRLSWTVPTASPEYRQAWAEIELVDDLGTADAVRLETAESVLIDWPFAPLTSRQAGSLRVRVGDDEGRESPWSEATTFEVGLLEASDWTAQMIRPAADVARIDLAPALVTTFALNDVPDSARLYFSAHGVVDWFLNDQRVGDLIFDPGWTSYGKRLRYRVLDVTDLLVAGRNVLRAELGNGWYRGRLGWEQGEAVYGDMLGVIGQLELRRDGELVQSIATDDTWQHVPTAILANDFYDGCEIDLAASLDVAPEAVTVVKFDPNILVPADSAPIRVVGEVLAIDVFATPSGRTIIDLGENIVGWVRVTVRSAAEDRLVTIRHAEVLEHGELGTRPLRTARATDQYRVSAGWSGELEPRFTFHGFRYVEIDGLDEVRANDVTGVVISSDLPQTGWFACSHAGLNRFHDNVRRSMRGNFIDVPTDCPQRDERLGWTGDIQVFSPTASFLADCSGFLAGWLKDLAVDQWENGAVPFVIPDVLHAPDPTTAAWGDAATIVPRVLWERFGDVEVLRRQLPSMRAWVDRVRELAGDDLLWTGSFQFGDWLDPDAPADKPGDAKADPDLVSTACFARSAQYVADAADAIGDRAIAYAYGRMAAEIRAAFRNAWVTEDGRMHSDAPTAYAMALAWRLLENEALAAAASERLAELVAANGYHIATGFVGTPIVMDALCAYGHVDTAYRLLTEESCPSWLYPVTMGATTIWERWDSMLPDGSINPGEMTSFNHYALGAVADWMHRSLAGLAPAAPGYRQIHVRPLLCAYFDHASARHLSPYGEASVAWRREDGVLSLEVQVPVGAAASIWLPEGLGEHDVGHGTHRWSVPDPYSRDR